MAASFIHKNRALFIDSDLAPLLKLHVMKKHRPDGCLDNMKLNYSHGSGETEKRRGKNVESHDYLKNVDSIKRRKKKTGPNCSTYGNPTDNPPGYDRLLTS